MIIAQVAPLGEHAIVAGYIRDPDVSPFLCDCAAEQTSPTLSALLPYFSLQSLASTSYSAPLQFHVTTHAIISRPDVRKLGQWHLVYTTYATAGCINLLMLCFCTVREHSTMYVDGLHKVSHAK